MAGLIGKAVQGISTGIGLVGEKYYDRKERKAALAAQEQSRSSTESNLQKNSTQPSLDDQFDNDERIWALDEASSPPADETIDSSADSDRIVVDLAHNVTLARNQQLQVHEGEVTHLPYPVIIPQRRPGSKARGWTRAYAPDLQPMGIDQDTFIQFLEGWDSASEGSPWLHVISVTSSIVGVAIPGPLAMGVTAAVSITVQVAQEIQGRYKANTFLDKMNQEVFMPSGLYAMVIVCKQDPSTDPSIQVDVETVNLENAKNVSKWGIPGSSDQNSTSKKLLRPIRIASGESNVDDMSLEIAPLIYPGLDDMVRRPELNRDENFKERLMRNKEFVANYFDRRAQADFAGNNPDAALTKASGDMPEFKTRFADPNHACNNGHLVSLVTGGKYVAQGLSASSSGGRYQRGGLLGNRGRSGGLIGGLGQRGGLLGDLSQLGGPLSGILGTRQESGFIGGRGRSQGAYGDRILHRRSVQYDNYHDLEEYSHETQAHGGRFGGGYQGSRGGLFQQRGSKLRKVGEDGKLKPREKQPERQPRGPIGYTMKGVRKVFKTDVLYLTIVNLPTEQEMEMAREAMGTDKKGWQDITQGTRR